MNGAHWHMVLNHLPIIIPIAALVILLISYTVDKPDFVRAAYLLFVLGALATLPAFLTGEGAEEVVEGLAGIDENYIKAHEEAAEVFAFGNYALGFLALTALFLGYWKKQLSVYPKIVITLFAFMVLFLGKQAGTTGGEIRHTEIRSGVSPAAGSGVETQEDGDDD
ncbi:MAG TPA: hypothetical protein PKA12_07040 [Saprospiraceae bacterium]|nr:hypothetical protein [Saprospiraceae bacterium]